MICRTSTLTAALALLALPLPGWSADPAPIKTTDRQQICAPPPPASKSESPIVKESNPTNFVIRDPAMAAPTPVKRANHEAELIPMRRIMLVQFGEEKALDALDALRDVTDELQLDLEAAGHAEEAARDAANQAVSVLDFYVAGAQDERRPIRPYPERRYAGYANQPWTITGLLDQPDDYYRQACEEEFCRQVWACAGGRQSSWFQRWRRDTRRGHEIHSTGRCGPCNGSSSLLSGLFIEPLFGNGLVGGPLSVCGRCQSATGLWGDHCVDGGCVNGG